MKQPVASPPIISIIYIFQFIFHHSFICGVVTDETSRDAYAISFVWDASGTE